MSQKRLSIPAPRIELPILRFHRLFHVGTLRLADAKKGLAARRESLEGNALSVSLCPNAWRRIAKLGGNPLWKLTKRDGVLVDIFEVRRHRPSKRALIEWGLEHGLCERREIHGFVYADEELGSEVEQIFESASAAAEEAESYGAATFKRRILAATERLTEANGTPPPRQPRDALEELAMLAGRATRAAGIAKIDGFYATEKYDPDAYSSPRGGIFPEAVEDWERERVDFRFVDDEVELDKAATEVRAEKLRIAPVEGANAEFSKKSRFVV